MTDIIYQFVHKQDCKRKTTKPVGNNPPVGVVAAAKHGDKVYIGWSKCHLTLEPFDRERGLKIAVGRASPKRFIDPVPRVLLQPMAEMTTRATKYFKDAEVVNSTPVQQD